ncbi:MAG TPA: glycine cleavage system protein GcvH [Clostridiales bacterium]|nr:glycine cleavage system protein GcvH [Clostridiales bacterium]
MTIVKEGLYYTKSHEWAQVQGDVAKIGISDYAQNEMGDLVFAEAAPAGRRIKAGDPIGAVESVKMASDIYSPVSGEIINSQSGIGDHPEQINADAFGSWFVAIRLSDPAELASLMDAAAYEAFCQAEG